jgi:hypothetical protein
VKRPQFIQENTRYVEQRNDIQIKSFKQFGDFLPRMSDRDYIILQNIFSAWDFVMNIIGRKENREEFDNDSNS